MSNIEENNKKEYKNIAIIYIDGSALPNPGNYGSGIHGYIYNEETLNSKDNNKPKKYRITNIGYVAVNDLSKECADVKPYKYLNGAISFKNTGTNNMAEVEAFLIGVEAIIKYNENYVSEANGKVNEIIFKTDSLYLINVIKHIKKGNKGTDRPNPELWERANKLLMLTNKVGITITIDKVKAHSYDKETSTGELGNHLADRLALMGRVMSNENKVSVDVVFSDANKYWKPKQDRHPFLFGRQLFFTNTIDRQQINSGVIKNKPQESTYGILNYKTDVEPGRSTADAGFGIVKLNNSDELIEDTIYEFTKRLGTLSIISTVDLAELYSQNTIMMHRLFKSDIFTFKNKQKLLEVMEESKVAYTIKPAGLANNAFEKLVVLEQIIDDYKNNKKIKNRHFIDITKQIYTTNDKGATTCHLEMSEKILNVNIEIGNVKLPVLLELGREILGRNQFKKIEKLKPKVIMVIDKVSEIYYEYYTIVNLEKTNDIACYVNFYSNGIYLKKDTKKNKSKK